MLKGCELGVGSFQRCIVIWPLHNCGTPAGLFVWWCGDTAPSINQRHSTVSLTFASLSLRLYSCVFFGARFLALAVAALGDFFGAGHGKERMVESREREREKAMKVDFSKAVLSHTAVFLGSGRPGHRELEYVTFVNGNHLQLLCPLSTTDEERKRKNIGTTIW